MLDLQIYDAAIVGADPRGLSLAAHLRADGVKYQIFARPMEAGRRHCLKGSGSKLDGFAINLSDLAPEGIEYNRKRIPADLDSFAEYRPAFQRRFATRRIARSLRLQGAAVARARGGEARSPAPAIPAP